LDHPPEKPEASVVTEQPLKDDLERRPAGLD
jgi:hypothetical protein